jgi:hypothetical protein
MKKIRLYLKGKDQEEIRLHDARGKEHTYRTGENEKSEEIRLHDARGKEHTYRVKKN